MEERHDFRFPNSSGFTLLELILVMVLASLMLGLATLFFANTLPSARLGATSRDICSALRQARVLAQNRGEEMVFTLDLDTKQYGLEGAYMKRIPADISIGVRDSLLGEIAHGKYPILFHTSGGAEGGRLVLWHGKKAVFIDVDPVVGSVKVRQ